MFLSLFLLFVHICDIAEDEQFEEEKIIVMKEIKGLQPPIDKH